MRSFTNNKIESKHSSCHYEKLYSKSFIDGEYQLFIDASRQMGETCIAKDKLNDLFKVMREVPLYKNDEKKVSVDALQNEICTLHNDFEIKNINHPYLSILTKLEQMILLVDKHYKNYLPRSNDKAQRYPLLKQLNLYEEEKENNERILPNFFIEYVLELFLNISRGYQSEFMQDDIIKTIVKSMKEYKTISIFKENLKKIQSGIKENHPYIPILNNLLVTVNDFLSVSHFSLEVVGDRKGYERNIHKAKWELAKDTVGLIACSLWAPVGTILNGCGIICEEVPLPRPMPSDPQSTQYWHLCSPRNSIKSFYNDMKEQKEIITNHSVAPLRQTMK